MKRFSTLVLGALGLLGAGGCGPSARATNGPDWATVTVSGRALLTNAPILIADAEGYFAAQRIRLEWAEMSQSTAQAIPVLAQGKLDVLAGALSSGMLNALASGAPIRVIADKGNHSVDHCAATALVLRRSLADSGKITSLAHLRGRRLSANDVGISGYFLERQLEAAGLTFDDVRLVKMPYPSSVDALNSGAVDVASMPEPWLTLARDAGHVILPYSKSVLPRLQSAVLMFGPSLLKDRPDVGRRFVLAYLQGVRQYAAGKTERNLDILAERLSMDRALLARTCWQGVRIDGHVDTRSLLEFQKWSAAQGHLRSSMTAEQLWDSSFVVHARQALAADSSASRGDAP
jgi:NitT/TauT family transport system substrate-binding protein